MFMKFRKSINYFYNKKNFVTIGKEKNVFKGLKKIGYKRVI